MDQSVAQLKMTADEALKWIAGIFNESPEKLDPATPKEDVAEWDSIGLLTLMAEMDEQFEIILTEEEMEAMAKVDDILEVLRKHNKLT